jgi:hypothetical protein
MLEPVTDDSRDAVVEPIGTYSRRVTGTNIEYGASTMISNEKKALCLLSIQLKG